MRDRSYRWRTAVAVACALSGCLPEIPDDEVTETIEAEFDPSAEPSPAIPAPTDLVYDTTTGHLYVETEVHDAPIARDLAAFLNSLDGWPASMAASCTFLGEIDPSSVTADTVQVWDITDVDSGDRGVIAIMASRQAIG